MNEGHLILHPRTKGNKQKRKCPARQKIQCSPNQKRESTTHFSLYLIEKNVLCLYNSWKGTSTGATKPHLLSMGGLQEWLCQGQEGSFPVRRTCSPTAAQHACVHSACPTASLQLHQGRWKACRRWTKLCLHLNWDAAPSEAQAQPLSPSTVNETFSHREQLGIKAVMYHLLKAKYHWC